MATKQAIRIRWTGGRDGFMAMESEVHLYVTRAGYREGHTGRDHLLPHDAIRPMVGRSYWTPATAVAEIHRLHEASGIDPAYSAPVFFEARVERANRKLPGGVMEVIGTATYESW